MGNAMATILVVYWLSITISTVIPEKWRFFLGWITGGLSMYIMFAAHASLTEEDRGGENEDNQTH